MIKMKKTQRIKIMNADTILGWYLENKLVIDNLGYCILTLTGYITNKWAYLSFDLTASGQCYDPRIDTETCNGGTYHIRGGKEFDRLDKLYHMALAKYADSNMGKRYCKIHNGKVNCRLNIKRLLDVFRYFVADMLHYDEKILVLVHKKDKKVFVIYKKR